MTPLIFELLSSPHRVMDSPTLPNITLQAHYVIITGQLTIGTPTRHFSQRISIELTPNLEANRTAFKFTSFPPADPASPRNLGHKAFAVVSAHAAEKGKGQGKRTQKKPKKAPKKPQKNPKKTQKNPKKTPRNR